MGRIIIVDEEFLRFGFENKRDITDIVETDDKMLLALSLLLGRDYLNNNWKPVIVDADGRLLVSSGEVKTSTVNQSNPTVTNVSASILIANTNRKQVLIQNIGATDCYLSFGTNPATVNHFLLEAGSAYLDDVYIGEIFAIVAAGTTELRIAEAV